MFRRLDLRRCLLALALLSCVGCEQMTTIITQIEFPSNMSAAARSEGQLHLRVDRITSSSPKMKDACAPVDPASLQPAEGWLTATERGYELMQKEIPSVPAFCAAVWFDTNKNEKIDAGDAVGKLDAPYPSQRSEFFGSSRYDSPPIVLALVP